MIKLKIDGSGVTYDTLEDAKVAVQESGLGLAFWRETLTECAENEAMWNEFLNDLWQSGAEDEAERLDRTFPKDAPRQWLLVALTLGGCDPWDAFLAEWKAQGDERIMAVVNSPAFAPWLKQVQTKKYDLLVRAFGEDASKWPNDLLLKVLKSDGTEAEIAEWKAVVEERSGPKPGDEMTVMLPGGVPMTFCWCPATTSEEWKKISGGDDFFWMGSPESEPDRSPHEELHRVKLTQGFWMGKYPVTQRQWESVTDSPNPSHFKGKNRPVEQITWDDHCQGFLREINAVGDFRFSLPTEAQWEFACRAGTITPFCFGSTLNGDKANCDGTEPYGTVSVGHCRQETSPVALFAPNAWGICDMHGNVWEWCQDWYGDYSGDATDPKGPFEGTDRILRGGSWTLPAWYCRSAFRNFSSPDTFDCRIGFRLVCSVGPRRWRRCRRNP